MSVVFFADEIQDARDTWQGFCENCGAFTRDDVEPDTADICCPECRDVAVCGVDVALVLGCVEVAS